MTVVTENLDLPSGVDPDYTIVTVYLAGTDGQRLAEAYNPGSGTTIVGEHKFNPDPDGAWTLDLTPNDDLIPAGTVWARKVSGQPAPAFATVPTTGGPYRWDEILADPPGALASAALSAHEADQAIGDGVHGVVVHDFARDGWSGFTPEVMSVDGGQVFDTTVVDGRGRVTGTQPADGNHRVAYLRAGTTSAATVEWMRWRPEDGPPDWGDPRVQRRDIAPNANVPELPVGPGLCALWGAHFHTGSYGEFGLSEFRQL